MEWSEGPDHKPWQWAWNNWWPRDRNVAAPAGAASRKIPPAHGLPHPPAPCGYLITLEDRILFDFDKADLRADATATVDALAGAFVKVGPQQLEIRGHTDAKGSADYNQTLSERRAETVEKALKERSVAGEMKSEGFGKTKPVAANEIDGKDNPASRQLNRRVEIYVPNE